MTRPPGGVGVLAVLFRDLAVALRAGFSPADALAIIRQDQAFGRDGRMIEAIADRVQGGETVATAMARHPTAFAAETTDLVRAGEAEGRLGPTLGVLADDYERRSRGWVTLASALTWPAALSVVLLIVLFVIMVFVIPTFNSVFSSFGGELPAATELLVQVSDFTVQYWWIVVGVVALAGYIVLRPRASAQGRLVDAILFRVPFVRAYLLKTFVSRLAGILAVAARGDVPLVLAIAHLRATAGDSRVGAMAQQLENDLNAGQDLAVALGRAAALPRRLGVLVGLGGKGGNLEAALAQAVDLYDADAARSVLALERAAMIACYLALAVVIGFTVIAVYLPIFKLGQTI